MKLTTEDLSRIISEELAAVLDEKASKKARRKKRRKAKKKKAKKAKKPDRCTRIAKRKYDVWPSAYASGAVVKCRQGKIWKGLKEGELSDLEKAALEKFEEEGGAAGEDMMIDFLKKKGASEEEAKKILDKISDVHQHGDLVTPMKEDIGDQVNEDLLDEEDISEGLKYHIKEGVGVDKNVYRPDSECFFNMFKEVRKLHKEGRYKLNENEKHYILETDLGEFGMFEGQEVPLDHPMVNEEKDPPIGKPSKNTEGGKKYKVFVRDPKTGNIRKITYGDKKGGLKGNWNSAEARASFAARHRCAEKSKKPNKRLTPGYWACRAHKDFGKNVPGRFW